MKNIEYHQTFLHAVISLHMHFLSKHSTVCLVGNLPVSGLEVCGINQHVDDEKTVCFRSWLS